MHEQFSGLFDSEYFRTMRRMYRFTDWSEAAMGMMKCQHTSKKVDAQFWLMHVPIATVLPKHSMAFPSDTIHNEKR